MFLISSEAGAVLVVAALSRFLMTRSFRSDPNSRRTGQLASVDGSLTGISGQARKGLSIKQSFKHNVSHQDAGSSSLESVQYVGMNSSRSVSDTLKHMKSHQAAGSSSAESLQYVGMNSSMSASDTLKRKNSYQAAKPASAVSALQYVGMNYLMYESETLNKKMFHHTARSGPRKSEEKVLPPDDDAGKEGVGQGVDKGIKQTVKNDEGDKTKHMHLGLIVAVGVGVSALLTIGVIMYKNNQWWDHYEQQEQEQWEQQQWAQAPGQKGSW
eukprot:gnl/MRDRNA2_/MRDRNA2_30443_c0_seq1.p1 gnl/MRDRNA2_/MRDRNA2_30443_c0~~gnl/MRDRNA2_/MRDRNA2_30443_c0_seq1.p1  ORF type:complete len:270 (-),score=55.23 gnl/MRDRNA2_/MRDRNA2_30443_c0_seq1:70-879(-)